ATPGWGWRLHAPSSRRTVGRLGCNPCPVRARVLRWFYRPTVRASSTSFQASCHLSVEGWTKDERRTTNEDRQLATGNCLSHTASPCPYNCLFSTPTLNAYRMASCCIRPESVLRYT